MKHSKTILAASIVASLYAAAIAYAAEPAPAATDPQQAPADSSKKSTEELGTVVVTGIRESLKASLDRKRDADATIEAVTAEDIGKFPATNVAEALTQIPGVTIDRSIPATQRVSVDGCDPSLNLSYLDGHPVAQATWLFGDSPNRGFNYSLLAPEVLGSLEVYKTSEARLPEGSLCGTVFMHTVQPLDVESNTLSASVGYNYNSMVSSGKPNASVFYGWHNEDKTFGIDVSAQHYEQYGNREGMENYGYTSVAAVNAAAVAAGNNAIQNLLNSGAIKGTDQIPNQLSASNFQQVEKRDSFTSNIEFKPSEFFSTTVSLLYTRDNLNNVNQSMYPWATHNPAGITSLTEGANGIIVAGTQVGTPCNNNLNCVSNAATYTDNNARYSRITTKGVDWRAKLRGDTWDLTGQAGVSSSRNPQAAVVKEIYYGGGFNWNINKGVQFTDPTTANDPNYWADNGWGGNEETLMYKARDVYAQADFVKNFDGFLNQLLLGVRYAEHWESQTERAYTGPQALTLNQIGYGGLTDLSGLSSLGLYPSMVTHVQTCGYSCLFNAVLSSPGFGSTQDANVYWGNTWNVNQKNEAAYWQANFGNDNLHGNIGTRFVHTQNTSFGFNVPASCSAADSFNCEFPPGFGYIGQSSSHNDVLPAFNIAYTVAPDVILRGATAEQIAYAPYNQMAPYFTSNDTVLTAVGGNPNLSPYKAWNSSASAEWYFAPESVLAATLFYKNIINYIVNAATVEERINGSWSIPGYAQNTGNSQVQQGLCTPQGVCKYSVTAPVDGGHANAKGVILSYQQAFGDSGFGLRANYTYTDATTQSGGALPYSSKNSYTFAPYFEKGPYTASLAYTYRSSYLAGGYVAGAPATFVDGFKELDGSLGYAFTNQLSLTFNALNLLNSKYYQYLGSKTQFSNEYKTGRQYLLTLHFKL